MKTLKTFFGLIAFTILISSCNRNLPEDFLFGNSIENEDIEQRWWILTHKKYESPGIYLYNETTSTIELELELPENLESPHALAYDGTSLWVGGNGENESIYELNPETGTIRSEIRNISTEGIAVQDEYLYYSNFNSINKIEKNGSLIEEIPTDNSTLNIPDIAIDGNNLYYLRYSENESVIRLNLNSKIEHTLSGVETTGTYCLAIFNNEIITVTALNEINHNILRTGQSISTNATEIKGWITAIAPYFDK
ncbi:DUF5050 domain-containing protein [uncultured Algibacter sp.]|uniref:DUF5050 domain-containing protein n=1 Tax=uncultured Algibacter sp. TaxID=298659 RepID=UPI00260D283C|nr:DUF5050 domain-containing protein [uncultured Algibacter sp.]